MKKLICAVTVICLVLSATPSFFADGEQHSYSDLQKLYDTVVNYIFKTEASLTALITDEEDSICAKAMNAAKLTLLSSDYSDNGINASYNVLYSAFSLLMLINQRGQTAISPERITLLRSLATVILSDDFYELTVGTQSEKIREDSDRAVSVITNASAYTEEEVSDSLNLLYTTLYTAARLKTEVYYQNFNALDFLDILPSDWYFEAVGYVYNAGLFKGTSPTEFSPDMTMTRAMFITVLSRFAFAETVAGSSIFTDVPAEEYYNGPVLWASANGILDWVDGNEFLPDEPITRQEMFMCMYNYSRTVDFDDSEYDFSLSDRITDIDAVSESAQNAARWCYSTGVISGYGDGTVKPFSTATRAEVAQVFINLTEVIG